ncbi:hypothetical protein CUMW_038820 [Citrus unshiu]|nr:hypothetical protein CUMW_038820 [Citrus unshiu]
MYRDSKDTTWLRFGQSHVALESWPRGFHAHVYCNIFELSCGIGGFPSFVGGHVEIFFGRERLSGPYGGCLHLFLGKLIFLTPYLLADIFDSWSNSITT